MSRTRSLNHVRIVIGSLLLVGLVLAGGECSRSALAQEIPPRPTLTPSPPADEPDDEPDDDDQPSPSPTPMPTATLAPTAPPTLTSTPVLPTPSSMPVTGRPAGAARVWVVLGIGLVVSVLVGGIGVRRAS